MHFRAHILHIAWGHKQHTLHRFWGPQSSFITKKPNFWPFWPKTLFWAKNSHFWTSFPCTYMNFLGLLLILYNINKSPEHAWTTPSHQNNYSELQNFFSKVLWSGPKSEQSGHGGARIRASGISWVKTASSHGARVGVRQMGKNCRKGQLRMEKPIQLFWECHPLCNFWCRFHFCCLFPSLECVRLSNSIFSCPGVDRRKNCSSNALLKNTFFQMF